MDAVWTNVIHPNQLFNIEKLTELDSNILILIYFWHKCLNWINLYTRLVSRDLVITITAYA